MAGLGKLAQFFMARFLVALPLFLQLTTVLCSDDGSSYCLSRFHGVPDSAMTQEQRLLYRLMLGYDRASRPVFNATQSVQIRVGISLTQVLDVDEKNQVLTLNVWLDQEWQDERLVWNNRTGFENINILRIPCDLLWLPDIVLYNSVDNHNKGYMKALAMVHSDGHVFWPPIVRMRSSCKMDITFFPFDDQICKLKLGSWAYDGFQVDVHNRTTDIDLTNFVDNGEWTLVDTRVKRNVIYYPCCPEPFPDVTFYIQLRRRVLYYFLNVIIPCMLLSALTLTGFCLPPDSGEKVTLGLTVLLAFSVFMLLVAENMPPTSEYVPLIGVYLTIIMAMSATSVVFSVFVLNFHHKSHASKPPPSWIKFFAVIASYVTCSKVNFSDVRQTAGTLQENTYTAAAYTETSQDAATINDSHLNYEESDVCQSLLQRQTEQGGPDRRCNGTYCNGTVIVETPDNSGQRISALERVMLDYVGKVMSGHDRQSRESRILNDWREVARLIDRLFFCLFLLVTVVSTLVILIVCPLMKDITIDALIEAENQA